MSSVTWLFTDWSTVWKCMWGLCTHRAGIEAQEAENKYITMSSKKWKMFTWICFKLLLEVGKVWHHVSPACDLITDFPKSRTFLKKNKNKFVTCDGFFSLPFATLTLIHRNVWKQVCWTYSHSFLTWEIHQTWPADKRCFIFLRTEILLQQEFSKKEKEKKGATGQIPTVFPRPTIHCANELASPDVHSVRTHYVNTASNYWE